MTVTPEHAAAQFPVGSLTGAPVPQPGGHIHRNWVVATNDGRYLLQRLNTFVFRDVALLQHNIDRIGRHLRSRGTVSPRVWAATDGRLWWDGDDGSSWRLFDYLDGRRPAGPDDAQAVGQAFGRFAAALSDLPAPPLAPTIAGFHDLPERWAALHSAEATAPGDRRTASSRERSVLVSHGHLAHAFAGVPAAVVHGDAKAANVLIDPTGDDDPVVVDLDTTGPAPLTIDAGDLIRSCSVRAAEDEPDADRVVLEIELLLAVIGGWLAALPHPPRAEDIVRAAQAICWEQAVRFLTDYLEGDRYYAVERPEHNLDRTRTQLRLLDQLTARADDLVSAVARLRPGGR